MPAYFTANTVSELVCLSVAIVCLRNDKSNYWRLLIVYLFLTCVAELAGIHTRKVWHRPNYPVYNVLTVIECVITSCFFYYLYSMYRGTSRWLILWLGLFAVIYTAELYTSHFGTFVFKTATTMAVVFILACFYYYYLMLKDDRFRNLWTDAPFWWLNGTLLFYFGGTACYLFFEYLVRDTTVSFRSSARYIIFIGLNIILYASWSYSFICRYRQRTLSS